MRRSDFPELEQVYLDSACMSLRPRQVINKVNEYYNKYPVCPGRSNHSLSQRADSELGKARRSIARFIDAGPDELMLTSGTTESINTVARGFETGKVVLTDIEHNSDRIPWIESDADVVTLETNDDFLSTLESEVEEGDLVSMVHVSNLDGSELPVKEAAEIVHAKDAYILVDGAQSVPHREISVKDIGADFFAFSGHKMLGPSGTGGLYVSERARENLEPLKYGGGAVKDATFDSSYRKGFPAGFEPGLPNIAGFIGLGEAARYLEDVGIKSIERHEKDLTERIYEELTEIDGVDNIGSKSPGVVSLRVGDLDPHRASLMFDQRGIALRSGMHCVHPWFHSKCKNATLRASLYLYNDNQDVDQFISALKEIAVLG